tara:strand:- start:3513 stop:4448 length:936 start_codon:yes stop_codon:yes gene_type:complete
MGQAPKGYTSLSGQSGAWATDNADAPIIRVLGERHTGTRAMIGMIEALPHLSASYTTPAARGARHVLNLMKAAADVEARSQGGSEVQSAFRDAKSLARPRAACWKHAYMQWDDSFFALAGVIISQRNPYSWVLAMFSRPYHHVGARIKDLDTFISTPWLTIPRERMALAVASPVALWVEKLAAAQRFAKQAEIPVTFLAFEPFLADPVARLGAALSELGQSAAGLVALAQSTKTEEPLEKVQARHAAEPWRKWLTSAQVAAINAHLDPEVAEAAGYALENPANFPDVLADADARTLQDYLTHRQANKPHRA